MAAGPTLYSTQITNLNATPIVRNTAGVSGQARLNNADGYVTVAASDGAGTKYFLNRVKSNVIVKRMILASEAQGAGKVNVGAYYASDARYTPPGNSANVGVAIDDDFFATDVDLASKVQPTDITFESGTYTFDKMAQPLWQALGLSSDPGGFIDIVATVHTTDVTTGTGKLYLRTEFVEP
jgi:hypothetical protein